MKEDIIMMVCLQAGGNRKVQKWIKSCIYVNLLSHEQDTCKFFFLITCKGENWSKEEKIENLNFIRAFHFAPLTSAAPGSPIR